MAPRKNHRLALRCLRGLAAGLAAGFAAGLVAALAACGDAPARPVCGDGVLQPGEACDDELSPGAPGDGCSALCLLEGADAGPTADAGLVGRCDGDGGGCEREPNDTIAVANDFGALALPSGQLAAWLTPAGDRDVFVVTIPPGKQGDLVAETLDGPDGSVCLTFQLDPRLELLNVAGDVRASDDDGGAGFCARLANDRLDPGSYYVRVSSSPLDPSATFDYTLAILLTLNVCGDGALTGSEQCDDGNTTSGDGCDADCTPTGCGNGVITAGEPCDDGNGTDGDGCDSNCTITACGNGVRTIGEQCDDGNTAGGDGCAASCQLEPGCGNGLLDAGETCDDGMPPASGDGCDATCQAEPGHTWEIEPNDGVGAATVIPSPAAVAGAGELVHAALVPSGEQDWFTLDLPVAADVRLESFGPVAGFCPTDVDTVIDLRNASGTTLLASDDDAGLGACSLIAALPLAAGTYRVRVHEFGDDAAVGGYLLQVLLAARCGDGAVTGSETCDDVISPAAPGDGCGATCRIEASCGNGVIEAGEQCDDTSSPGSAGHGCSAGCTFETIYVEAEPNDTPAAAAGHAALAGDHQVSGALAGGGDVDVFRIDLPAAAVVRLEAFDASAIDCMAGAATTLHLLDAAGAVIATDDAGGIGACAALVHALPAGTSYVVLEETGGGTGLIYWLELEVATPLGGESEPNDTTGSADAAAGADVVVLGGHLVAGDVDMWAITVGAGQSLRAEIVEGGAEACELGSVDSTLTLLDSTGAVVIDDDDGRGYCSRLDGTGSAPADPAAHGLAAGTYFLRVDASPLAAPAAAQFDYALQITLR